ncbi:MAG: transposase [Alphaproteobacteria bacterium]|nr:transposase [Alphaproteobacteria bacterium]
MWTTEQRRAADRRGLRYPSDTTYAEWALVVPLIPPDKRGSRPRTVNVREVLNTIFYVLATGCQRDALPKCEQAPKFNPFRRTTVAPADREVWMPLELLTEPTVGSAFGTDRGAIPVPVHTYIPRLSPITARRSVEAKPRPGRSEPQECRWCRDLVEG